MKPIKPFLSAESLMREAADRLSQSVRAPNILMYKPHPKQLIFHKSTDWGRMYAGGNRSGKTYSAIIEDLWYATNTHPYKETPPPPVRGRVVGVDFTWGVGQILIPMFKMLAQPSTLLGGTWDTGYSKSERVLTFENGSTIEFMSYDQDVEKFSGTSRHFIHYDEEPPKVVFDECQMRIIDTEGEFWISMTPDKGLTWIYDSIYNNVLKSVDKIVLEKAGPAHGQVVRSPSLGITIIEVDAEENPYLSELGRTRAMSMLDDDAKIARKSGKFVEMSGLVYKSFDPAIHVIPAFKPDFDWDWYSSTDHGWNNPTATLWHAVAPNGDVYTFSEHYASNMTVEEHATTMTLREQAWGRVPDMRVGDPAMKQTSGITGTSIIQEYGDRGIYITVEGIPRDVQIGIARIQQYLKINPATKKPRWFITDNCVNLINEMQRLHWRKYASRKMQFDNNKSELIHKKDDHACDSARYFFTCMPELSMADFIDPDAPAREEVRLDPDYGLALLRSITEGREIPEKLVEYDDSGWQIHEGIDLSDMYR